MATNGTGIGFGITISNQTVGVAGLLGLGIIGAHLVSNLFAKGRAQKVGHKTSEPTMVEAMFSEAQALATDPTIIQRNRDRVNQAIKQRRDQLKVLREKVQSGLLNERDLAEGIQKQTQDMLDQLEIPQHPHPTSVSPDLYQLFQNQNVDDLARKFAVPGGLILDPEERAYLEHQTMSYQGHADPTVNFSLREAAKKQAEAQRYAAFKRARELRHQQLVNAQIQRDAAQDAYVQSIHERKRARL